jgi:hypothetical protein
MKYKISSLLIATLLVILMVSPVSAGPGIGLKGVQFSLGSLVAEGVVTHLSKTDVKVVLQATGTPAITCTNQGANPAPGRNPSRISAADAQNLQDIIKNGRAPFDLQAVPLATLPGKQGGCPNNNWTAHVDFVFWENADIIVTNLAGDTVLLKQSYTCVTTRNPDTVTCTPK